MKPRLIAGTDEAGRGPLAGPVVAAAVVFDPAYTNKKIRDSKQLSAKVREQLYDVITAEALGYSIVAVGHHRIQKVNIREASRLAMALAATRLSRQVPYDKILIDGNVPIEIDIEQQTVVDGDALHLQISAASILAKVWRDRLMQQFDQRYPQYGFAQHAGYGTRAHREAIRTFGPCPIHRMDFRGVYDWQSVPAQEDPKPSRAWPARRAARAAVSS